EIEFVHPHTQEKMQFTSGLPDDFNQIMAILAN
ncbi:MAG: RluA family pseudouridine synthase, partial [Gemmatimonadetes bacterium]